MATFIAFNSVVTTGLRDIEQKAEGLFEVDNNLCIVAQVSETGNEWRS